MKNLIIGLGVVSALIGCTIPGGLSLTHATPKLDSLVGTAWQANGLLPVAASGSAGAVALRAPRLQFMSLTQVGGNGGCNGFGGPVVIKGEALQIGPLAATRKMCVGPEMAIERQFFADLDKVRKARLVSGHLELLDSADVLVLRLNRAE
jgi:heat shock protein HslJ